MYREWKVSSVKALRSVRAESSGDWLTVMSCHLQAAVTDQQCAVTSIPRSDWSTVSDGDCNHLSCLKGMGFTSVHGDLLTFFILGVDIVHRIYHGYGSVLAIPMSHWHQRWMQQPGIRAPHTYLLCEVTLTIRWHIFPFWIQLWVWHQHSKSHFWSDPEKRVNIIFCSKMNVLALNIGGVRFYPR